MATRLTDGHGAELLTVPEALEYINARSERPIKLRTLTSYIPARLPDGGWGEGRAAFPRPDLEVPAGVKRVTKLYSTTTLDRWLAGRPGRGNWAKD